MIDVIEDTRFLLQCMTLARGKIYFIKLIKKKLSKDLSVNIKLYFLLISSFFFYNKIISFFNFFLSE